MPEAIWSYPKLHVGTSDYQGLQDIWSYLGLAKATCNYARLPLTRRYPKYTKAVLSG